MPRKIDPIGCVEDIHIRDRLCTDALLERLCGLPVVYLIHFDEPLKHAQHYVGYTTDIVERMRCYRAGNADSSRLMVAVHKAEITWSIVRIWVFDTARQARDWEYQFKKGFDGKQHIKPASKCTVCRMSFIARNAERMRKRRDK